MTSWHSEQTSLLPFAPYIYYGDGDIMKSVGVILKCNIANTSILTKQQNSNISACRYVKPVKLSYRSSSRLYSKLHSH